MSGSELETYSSCIACVPASGAMRILRPRMCTTTNTAATAAATATKPTAATAISAATSANPRTTPSDGATSCAASCANARPCATRSDAISILRGRPAARALFRASRERRSGAAPAANGPRRPARGGRGLWRGVRGRGRRPPGGGAPPAWVFEVVWGALFLCIGASAYLFWFTRAGGWAYTAGLWALLANLLANRYWTRLYFTYRSVPLAVADILLILATGGFYMACALLHMWDAHFFAAAALFAPYMLWTLFALVLVFRDTLN